MASAKPRTQSFTGRLPVDLSRIGISGLPQADSGQGGDAQCRVVVAKRGVDAAVAERRRLIRRHELLAYPQRATGRRGAPVLREVIEREGGPAFTRSAAERRLLSLVRAAELPPPRTNARFAGAATVVWMTPTSGSFGSLGCGCSGNRSTWWPAW